MSRPALPFLQLLSLVAALSLTPPAPAQEKVDPLAPSGGPTAPAEQPAEPEPPAGADLSEAGAMVRSGDFEGAEQALADLQEAHPEDPALLLLRGEVLLSLRRERDALEVLRSAAEIDPGRPRLQFQLGIAHATLGETEAALAAFAREPANNEDPAVRSQAHLNRSLLLQQEKRWEEAAEALEAVIELQPERQEVYGDLAALCIQSGDLDGAQAALERGLAAGFQSGQHFYSLGARVYRQEDYSRAEALFRQALELDPGLARAERSLAAALDKLDRKDEAVRHLRRYLELEPDAPDAAAVQEKLRAVEGS